MKALFVKNIGIEGPGTLGAFLHRAGYATATVDLDRGDALPAPDSLALAVILGGPMNVYEEERYPFLRDETAFIETCLARGVKVIGLCLGAQLIARVLGARVYKNRVKEIGWLPLALTPEGKSSRFFQNLPDTFPVFQWHGDTFDIPAGAKNLATSDRCAHQAFATDNALALQFHLEVEGEHDLAEWCALYRDELTLERGDGAREEILKQTREETPRIAPLAERFYKNLHDWITGP